MLGVVFVLIPGLVVFLVWSTRRAGRRDGFDPGSGRQRWTAEGELDRKGSQQPIQQIAK